MLLWTNSVVALFVNSRRWSCVIPDKKLYGNFLYWCKDVRDFDGATQWVIATVPGRRVWLSTPACAIVAVRLGKALKDAHGALKEAKQSARPCDPLLLKIAQSHYNQSQLWSRLHTTLAQITRITPMWIYTHYTVLEFFSPFRIFEQLALALKKRVCPEIFHCIEYILCIQDFWATCVCPKHKVALKICTALNISSL